MSWDAVLLKIRGPLRPAEEVEEDDYLPLGTLKAVTAAISAAFPEAEWDDRLHASCSLDKYTGMLFDLEGLKDAKCVLVNVSGSCDPIPALLKLANPNGWVIMDVSAGEFIDPKKPSPESWHGYR